MDVYCGRMRNRWIVTVGILLLGGHSRAASKLHVVSFGKWTSVKWMVGADEETPRLN